ncbi:hypothetical protein SH449x_005459 [Pirellulaceae bacterium SH449]
MKWNSLTLREMFFLMVIVAIAICCYMLSTELSFVRQRLLRYGDQPSARRLLSNEIGIEVRQLVNANDIVVLEVLAKSNRPFKASLVGDRNGGFGTGHSMTNHHSGYEELVFTCTFDHFRMLQKLKYGAYGYSIREVPSDFKLADKLRVFEGISILRTNTSGTLFDFDNEGFALYFADSKPFLAEPQ